MGFDDLGRVISLSSSKVDLNKYNTDPMKNSAKIIFFVLASFAVSMGNCQKVNFSKYTEQSIERIRVASVSVLPKKWDKEENWKRIDRLVRKAVDEGDAEIVVTPEGALDGYVINEVNAEKDQQKKDELVEKFIELAEPLDGKYILKAGSLSDELNIYLVLGCLEKDGENLYNSAILFDPEGDIIGKYSKTHFAQGYTINPSCYTPGEQYPVFQTPFGKVGMMICYDRQLPEPARILSLKGAQILFVPSYGSYTDKDGWNTVLLRTRAYENQVPLVFSHPFQSILLDEDGDIRALGKANEVVFYEINTSPERYEGRFKNRKPETYGELMK
jgi:predicted amidohydrolase